MPRPAQIAFILVLGLSLHTTNGFAQDDPEEKLLWKLSTGDLAQRLELLDQLAERDSATATEALLVASSDPSPIIRQLAVAALAERKAVDIDVFQRLAEDPEASVRISNLAACAKQPSFERMAIAYNALADESFEVRLSAIEALAAAPMGSFSLCPLIQRWREATQATTATRETQETPALTQVLESEGLAFLLMRNPSATDDCQELAERERAQLEKQATRFLRFRQAPELNMSLRQLPARIDELELRLRNAVQSAVSAQRERCVNSDLQPLIDEARATAEEAIGAEAQDQSIRQRLDEQLLILETRSTEIERCVDESYYYDDDDAKAPAFWMQAIFSSFYDDHFFARRQDVAELRVDHIWSHRAALQSEWSNLDRRIENGEQDSLFRVRTELAHTSYLEESQLSGLESFLDLQYRQLTGKRPPLPAYDEPDWYVDDIPPYAWVLFANAGLEQGTAFFERGWPERLVAPHVDASLLLGARELSRNEWTGAFALEGGATLYYEPLAAPAPQASPSVLDFFFLNPPSPADAGRLWAGARARLGVEVEGELLLDATTRFTFYPGGMPRLSSDGFFSQSNVFTSLHVAELGYELIEDDLLILARLGTTFLTLPEPSEPLHTFITGRLHVEYHDGGRYRDGLAMYGNVFRRAFEGPGIEESSEQIGARLGFGVWEFDSNFFTELDLAGGVDVLSRELLVSRDADALVLYVMARAIFDFEVAGFELSYRFNAESDDTRQSTFLATLDEYDSRAIARHIVMLSIFAHFGNPNPAFFDARANEWGFLEALDPYVPHTWWAR
ncbi:MAG: hypothetical protein RBU37_20690 [Myxococcota bacterium]|nr:hypothetical protein [Myxococcota bacterium]